MTDPASGTRSRVSIDEGLFAVINGVEQWLTIRGSDLGNPALLLVGGPGAAFTRMAPFFAPWEQRFTLVQWDQPGGGATWARSRAKGGDAVGPLTLDRLVRDGLAVVEFVRRRLRIDKIILLGVSGGSIVGLMMAKQRPDLFSAYVGSGQIVDWARQDALSYAMVLEQARARGDAAAVVELEGIGAPPYRDTATDAVKAKYAGALTPAEQAVFAALDPAVMAAVNEPPAGARYAPVGLALPADPRALGTAAYDQLRGEIMAFEARRLGLKFEVPMVFLQGARDAYTVSSEVEAYAAEIEAPAKRMVKAPGGGHSAFFLRDAFLDLLVRHVRPLVIRS